MILNLWPIKLDHYNLHKEWVRKLASDLRGSGVDAILDQWDIRLGDDLAVFMESGITSADRVIAVCSESYVLKANEGKGGVGYEKMIVTGELVKNLGTNKFIPLVRGNNTVNKVPVCLSSRAYIDFENDNEYEARLKELICSGQA
ncbi:toll/interleukin-1 receptor domain-containing protein [Shewanella sp. TB4-MNA-CIBAN-0142]|uniref:toll/interleukin-1 receptor domain-containing protein n=1 Tax=Shewanella sp. TB4-MNA-CIBAN-0142 TaxID=3140464 RepID=UPI003323F2FA